MDSQKREKRGAAPLIGLRRVGVRVIVGVWYEVSAMASSAGDGPELRRRKTICNIAP
jgi:hypothetical protein